MGKIRSLKPQAFTSLTLSLVPVRARWTFAGLWTLCDDEGRMTYDARVVKGALYSLDEDVTAGMVAQDVQALLKVGAVCIYQAGQRTLLHIPSWHDHQHPNRKYPSRLPACTNTEHGTLEHVLSTAQAVSEQDASTVDAGSEHSSSGSGSGKGSGSRSGGSGRDELAPAAPEPKPATTTQKKTKVPDSFDVTLTLRDWARANGIDCNLTAETQQWHDFHVTKGDTAADWTASWRYWMRNTKKFGSTTPTKKPTTGGDW